MSRQLYGGPSRNTRKSSASRHDRIAVHADFLRGVAQPIKSVSTELDGTSLVGGWVFGRTQIRGTISTWAVRRAEKAGLSARRTEERGFAGDRGDTGSCAYH